MQTVKLLNLIALLLSATSLSAQWTRTAPNTYLATATDKVGVGTTTPNAKLDVVCALPAFGTYDHQYWSTDNSGYSLRLQTTWSNTTGINQQFVQRSNGVDFPTLSFYTGKVGIGTATPTAKLDVNFNIPAQGTYDVQNWGTGNPAFFLKLQTTWDNYGITEKFVQRAANVDYTVLSFFNGNVGIGIDNAASVDAKLAVKGTIHTQEVKVDLYGAIAPDYVFDKSYDLRSLEEVERFINENNHLPEIPSASDMEKNGVNLKEMNLLLLKKIEELTLHIIRQEKKLQELEEQLTK